MVKMEDDMVGVPYGLGLVSRSIRTMYLSLNSLLLASFDYFVKEKDVNNHGGLLYWLQLNIKTFSHFLPYVKIAFHSRIDFCEYYMHCISPYLYLFLFPHYCPNIVRYLLNL